MKFNKNLLKEKWFSYTIALCSAVVLYMLLTHFSGILQFLGSIWHVFAPVIMAFVIAYILDPLENVFSKYVFYRVEQVKLRHTLSVVFSFLSVILFIVILMVALVPQVIDSIIMFAGNLNSYVLSFQRLMRQLNSFALQHDLDLSKFISSGDELLQSITRILPENLNKIVNASYSIGAKMFDWIISFILAIYLMMDQARLRKGFSRLLHALLPDQAYRNTASFWSRCNKILIQYIAFDLLDGMIIGLCNWVFMVVAGMPYVAIISVVVGVTNLAPTFGPMIGAVIGAFILVLVKPWYALLFLIFTLILQTLDGYVIKPRLFGEQLGVSAVWILISLVIGGRLLGVPGILLAIPFAAIVDFVYQDYVIKWLETQNEEHKKGKHGTLSGIKAAGDIAVSTTADLAELAAMVVTEAADLISSAADDDEGVYSEAYAPAESPTENINAGEKAAPADPPIDDIGAGEKAAPADPPKDDIDAGEKAAYEESPAEEITSGENASSTVSSAEDTGTGEKAVSAISPTEDTGRGEVIETAESAAGDACAEAAADAPVPTATSPENGDSTEKQNQF